MNITTAKRLTGGGLGFPSKMPGTSYGLPAQACIVGAKLAQIPGSVCHGCYALKNNYQYPSVKTAHARRLASITDPAWTMAMVTLLLHSGETYHRWHDSGDLQSVQHLTKICAVAAATPNIKHWLPTREHAMVAAYVKQGGVVPDNLCIRISATMVDGPATSHWPTTSGVHTAPPANASICPAPTQGNKCGDCRACWSRAVPHISYHKH